VVPDRRVGVGEASELEAPVEEVGEGHGHQTDARFLLELSVEVDVVLVHLYRVVGLDSCDAQLRHPGCHLEPLLQGGFGHEPVVESAPARGEIPDPHTEAEFQLLVEVLQHLFGVSGQTLAPEVSQFVCHHPSPWKIAGRVRVKGPAAHVHLRALAPSAKGS